MLGGQEQSPLRATTVVHRKGSGKSMPLGNSAFRMGVDSPSPWKVGMATQRNLSRGRLAHSVVALVLTFAAFTSAAFAIAHHLAFNRF